MNNMCTKGFDFKPKTWTRDYFRDFDLLKEAILGSIAVTFPDYTLPWIVRTDASVVAWGAVLIQVKSGGEYECIDLESGKWTDSTKNGILRKKKLVP
jgi:hypothetical protein